MATAPTAQTVRYALDWQAPQPSAGKPRITQLVLRTWSVQLAACSQSKGNFGWSAVPAAWADHAVAADPSLWTASLSETWPSWAAPLSSPPRPVHGTPCELLWVVSAGTQASGAKVGDPAFSAVVQWTDAGGEHTRTLATPVANARKLTIGVLPNDPVWALRLVRTTEGALDGLNLASDATELLAWTVLDRIVQSATVSFD